MLAASRIRIVIALVFAISAIGAFAAPASAETILKGCRANSTSSQQGDCGDWEVYDASVGKKGAVCVYGTSYPYKLKQITVRPPLMHGLYSYKTKVRWRFKVERMSVNSGPWTVEYTSSNQAALADDAVPAYVGNGFSRRAWTAPSNPAGYFRRIVIELEWLRNGSVEGYVKLKYDWYKALRGNSTHTNPDYCLQSY